MDENKSPQDFFNEIFEKSQSAEPPVPPPRFEPPGDDDPPPTPPPGEHTGKRGAETAAKLLPWPGVVLGAALLVMGVCILQLVRIDHRLDELQEAVETVQSVDSLQRENKALQNQLQAAQEAAERDSETQRNLADYFSHALNTTAIQKWRSDYLFYIGQFMDNGDYPMAAMAVSLSAYRYFSTASDLADVPYNPAQTELYQAYCQELLDKGYLQEPSSGYLTWGGANYECTEKYDPNQVPDMAALGILWSALNQYYVLNEPSTAAQYLVEHQQYLLQYLDSAATDYTIRLYEQLAADLMEVGYLVQNDGVFDYCLVYGPGSSLDIQYGLPFDPPPLP